MSHCAHVMVRLAYNVTFDVRFAYNILIIRFDGFSLNRFGANRSSRQKRCVSAHIRLTYANPVENISDLYIPSYDYTQLRRYYIYTYVMWSSNYCTFNVCDRTITFYRGRVYDSI